MALQTITLPKDGAEYHCTMTDFRRNGEPDICEEVTTIGVSAVDRIGINLILPKDVNLGMRAVCKRHVALIEHYMTLNGMETL